jgi:hypothetical protein
MIDGDYIPLSRQQQHCSDFILNINLSPNAPHKSGQEQHHSEGGFPSEENKEAALLFQ